MAILDNVRVNGRALRAIRTDQQASLRAIADAAGISAPYLSRIERDLRGTSFVSDEVVEAIAAALAMPPQAIVAATRSAP